MAETTQGYDITNPDYPRDVTFEQVWAALRDLAERHKETERVLKENAEREKERSEREREREERLAKEYAEREKERAEREKAEEERLAKETAKREKEREEQQKVYAEQKKAADERMAKLDKIVARNSKQMGDLHRKFGQLAEHLVLPNINKRFNELGYRFGEALPGGTRIFGEDGKVKAEVDILLQNGDTIMAIEIKVKPAEKDIEHHTRRLEILRDHRRKTRDYRKIQGAVAGAIFDAVVKKAVIEAGLFVIEQSGDTMKIEVPDGFVPREW